jgi:hypothetical protein
MNNFSIQKSLDSNPKIFMFNFGLLWVIKVVSGGYPSTFGS